MKELPFVIVVNVEGDLKSVRPEEFNDAVRLVIDTALVDVLNGRAGRVKVRAKRGEVWSTATNSGGQEG